MSKPRPAQEPRSEDRVSLHPLTPEQALRKLLGADPKPKQDGPAEDKRDS